MFLTGLTLISLGVTSLNPYHHVQLQVQPLSNTANTLSVVSLQGGTTSSVEALQTIKVAEHYIDALTLLSGNYEDLHKL